MRVLQIGSDRSKRGILVPGSPAYLRQRAYAEQFGCLDIVGYSLRSDGFKETRDGPLNIYPTRSWTKLLYGTNTLRIALRLPRHDVVSAQDPHDCGLLGLWIARIRGVPFHVQVHSDVLTASYGFHSITNFIRFHIALFVLARADGIRVVSNRIKASIEVRFTPKRPIAVLPIFVDIQKFRNPAQDQNLAARFATFKTKLLFVGRLEAEKNPSLALEVFASSAPADTCLIVVGTGNERALLEKTAHRLGVEERVFFEGETDSAPYYAVADLLLMTSDYEGYGLVIVEALAAGKPVLSTDVGVAREAGAIVAPAEEFDCALNEWFRSGPREGHLAGYPYANFDEYVAAYCADIVACTKLN